jgi:dolichol kinase
MFDFEYVRIYYLPLWDLILGLPILIIGALTIISTVIVYIFRIGRKSKDYEKLEEKWQKKLSNLSKARRDAYRKLSHVLIFIALFIIWIIGYTVVTTSIHDWVGMIPDENNTLKLYMSLISQQHSIIENLFKMGWFYYLIFFFFYALCLFLLANEITRKTKSLAFPFNLFPKLVMTEEEKQSYGTYLYFAIGQMFAAFLCPPMIFFCILGISSIADLMTSQVGIRWGKRHIQWNSDKTWEGTVAGTITAFILCIFFVGIIWSIIFTVAFMIFDIITSKPLNVSDNLLIPIGCALIYIFVRFFLDLNYYSLIYAFL